MSDATKHVYCSQCARPVGVIIQIQDREWLQVGDLIVRTVHGICAACGSEFHWSVSDRMLAELIRKIRRSEV